MIDAAGGGITHRLAEELCAWKAMPLDDTVAEAPHAGAKKISQHSKHAGLVWVSSSIRLQQNLRGVRSLPSALQCNLDELWPNAKSVLQPERSRDLNRNVRMNFKKCCGVIYQMSFAREAVADMVAASGPGNRDGGGDDTCEAIEDGAEGDGQVVQHGGVLVQGGGEVGDRQQIVCAIAEAGGSEGIAEEALVPFKRHQWCRTDEEVLLMRQFLAAALDLSAYYSVRVQSEDADDLEQLFAFQVLTLEHRPILLKTFEDEAGGHDKALYAISIQPLEIWNPPALSHNLVPRELEVFAFAEPTVMDVLGLVGDGMLDRARWQQWEVKESDLQGCHTLHGPEQLSPKAKLHDKNIPVLSLLDTLHTMGFTGVVGKVTHSVGGALHYDRRHLARQRRYLQCLAAFEDLLAGGVQSFPSGGPQAFYELLLRTKAPVPLQLSAKEYRRRLAELDGNVVAIAALDREPDRKKLRTEVGL